MNSKSQRNDIQRQVFDRDDYMCVNCGNPPVDAHHLIERRLWPDGGYHLDNLVSLCYSCHMDAESTLLSVESLRTLANIKTTCLPDGMDKDLSYDKWGNILVSKTRRLKGPLFDDPSVQKALSWCLDQFSPYVKYPRTPHLPWSHATTRDDFFLGDTKHFFNKEVVVTEKLDGANVAAYHNYYHPRSVDSSNVSSWFKSYYWSHLAFNIPEHLRLYGEDLYYRHSIAYEYLESYYYVFSVWEGLTNLSWDDTVEWCQLIGVPTVPVLWEGVFNESTIRTLKEFEHDTAEGYVIRVRDSFHLKDFQRSVAKYVRPNHMQSIERWSTRKDINHLIQKEGV